MVWASLSPAAVLKLLLCTGAPHVGTDDRLFETPGPIEQIAYMRHAPRFQTAAWARALRNLADVQETATTRFADW